MINKHITKEFHKKPLSNLASIALNSVGDFKELSRQLGIHGDCLQHILWGKIDDEIAFGHSLENNLDTKQ